MSLTERLENSNLANEEIIIEPGISLRRVLPEHSQAMFALIDRNREHLSQFGDVTAVKYPTLDEVQKRNLSQTPDEYRYGIWDKDILVGFVKMTKITDTKMEVGYWLGAEFQGKGYMTKAVVALTRFATDNLGSGTILAKVVKANKASIKVLERAGYCLVREDPDEPNEVIFEFKTTG